MKEWERKDGETQLGYYKRITENRKIYDLDYNEWAKLLIDKEYSSENARKMYYCVKPLLDKIEEESLKKSSKSKIKEISDILGDVEIKKQELHNKTLKFNKAKRDFIKSVEIANDINQYIEDNGIEIPKLNYTPIENTSENKLVVQIGDFHVGYVINGYKNNYYNYEIAKLRLGKLLSEIKEICDLYNINTVIVANCGDSIENCYMRDNQSFECEFNLSEQIVKAEELLYSFITDISKLNKNVEFYSVGGNHNRLNQSKDKNLEGDSSNVVIFNNIRKFVGLSNNKRITLGDIDFKDDSCEFEVNSLSFKCLHGDNRTSESKKLFDSENSLQDKKYDVILRGHYHNFNISSQNNGGYVLTCGCLFGYNPYSVKRMSCTTNASQTLIVVGNKEIKTIKDVNLQIC